MRRITFMSILVLVMVAGVAQARHGEGEPRRMPGMMDRQGGVEQMVEHLLRAADKLEISDEQLERMFAVVDDARGELREVRLQMHGNHKALRETADPEQYDADAVATLAATQGELTTRMIVLSAQLRTDVMSILTAEQRSKVKDFREQRRGKRGRH